ERVLQAVRNGQFHVYAVRHVDEALGLLLGEPAGAPDDKGRFPEGSVNARVVERLRSIAEMGMEEDEKDREPKIKEVKTRAKPAAKPSRECRLRSRGSWSVTAHAAGGRGWRRRRRLSPAPSTELSTACGDNFAFPKRRPGV